MAGSINEIPEIAALEARKGIVRIPAEIDVPFTARVRRLVDTVDFRRLAHVTQLGLVALVYPGATHSRFEHAMGVYHLMLRYLRQLGRDPRFARAVSPHDAEAAIAAALLHDVGHWPFCHPIEDLHLADVPRHEDLAARFLSDDGALADVLHRDWSLEPTDVLALVAEPPPPTPPYQGAAKVGRDGCRRLLRSLLSGPIDADKMDYLQRDSLHAGVPYGRHFDQNRLIGSLVLNQAGDGLALTEKGKTAAELMVFARYVMFSEVYWHHAVRAATAMLGRAFYQMRDHVDLSTLFRETEQGMIAALRAAADGSPAAELLNGIFGPQRALYKRLAQFSCFENPEIYRRLAGRPYPWLVQCAGALAAVVSAQAGMDAQPHEVLIDAPPVQREVEFDVEIYFPKADVYRPLQEVSPVVEALAHKQFDDYVKRVRVYCHPRLLAELGARGDLVAMLERALAEVGQESAAGGPSGPHQRPSESRLAH